MKEPYKALISLALYGLIVLNNSKNKYSYGGPSIIRDGIEINRNPNLLHPEFADILEQLFINMRAAGYDPFLWEGYRSKERVNYLVSKGTGIKKSMHLLGKAADIISKKDYWSNSEFFQELGKQAKSLGLVWGGDFTTRRDFPHVEYHGQ